VKTVKTKVAKPNAKPSKKDDFPRGALRAIVLSLLAERAMHGYALARTLEERTAGAFHLREGSLYPALHELELEGLVGARWDKSIDGRKRRVYRITPLGRRECAGWREKWLAIAAHLHDLLRLPSPSPRKS
jgi:PadR family transcriptional regulator PadR